MNEVERIKKAYNKRKIQQKEKLYSYFNKGNLYMAQERERVILDLLRNFNFSTLSINDPSFSIIILSIIFFSIFANLAIKIYSDLFR